MTDHLLTFTAEAHSSLSKILYRLNAVIKRFTSGNTTTTDYQALLNLSNTSKTEAISTFEQLSHRLSRSSLALVPLSPGLCDTRERQHKRQKKSTTSSSKHARSKSAPELSVTPQGLVRPKAGRKQSSDSTKSSKASGATSPKYRTSKTPKSQSSQPPIPTPKQSARSRQAQNLVIQHVNESIQHTPPPQYTTSPIEPLHQRIENRKSFMSFASDSTKIGEIPEHKWTQTAAMQANNYPRTIYYPVQPYQEPEKQRSRFMKLFRR
jgi:hypothetical protein